jgi:type I restriction enzyme S subunit
MRNGWTRPRISQLLSTSIGGVWGSDPNLDEINVNVVRSTEFRANGLLRHETSVVRSVKKSQLLSRRLNHGDILLEKSGGGPDQPVGRVVFVNSNIPNNTVCSNFVQLVRPDREKADSKFVFLVMWQWHYENRTLQFQAQTTGIRNLRTPDYLDQEVDLPPLQEQKRIVDLISSVDSYIDALQHQADSAGKSRNAVLHELLSAGGDGWTETTLGKIFSECKNGLNYKDGEVLQGLRVSRIQTIADGSINLEKVGFVEKNMYLESKFMLKSGDILFSHINSLAHVGKVAIVQDEHLPLIHGMNLLKMKFIFGISQEFMFYVMQSEVMREEIRSRAQKAVNQVSINIANIKGIRIFLPPLQEQKRIVDLISSMDDAISAAEVTIAETKKLRSGLLSDLLSGNHEIPASYDKIMGAA